MKSHLLAASIGIAALFPATGAHAWAELDFIIENPTPAYPVLLQCVANYAAPCVGGGLAYSYQQIPYNPLDGHRWSYYRLAMGSKRVMFDLYDKR